MNVILQGKIYFKEMRKNHLEKMHKKKQALYSMVISYTWLNIKWKDLKFDTYINAVLIKMLWLKWKTLKYISKI